MHKVYISQRHQKTCDDIAGYLWRKILGHQKEVISELSAREHIAPTTARTYISDITDPTELARKISPTSMARHEQQVSRLKTLYEILEISPTDKIVTLTKEVNPKFDY